MTWRTGDTSTSETKRLLFPLCLVVCIACGAKPTTTQITTGALPVGVTIDHWDAVLDSHGDLRAKARIHNQSLRVITAVTLEATYHDCKVASKDMQKPPVASEPGATEGLQCETIGHGLLEFLSDTFEPNLAIPPGEARDLTAFGVHAPSARGLDHRLFWTYTPMLVLDEPSR